MYIVYVTMITYSVYCVVWEYRKNYKEGIHYIITSPVIKKHGGHNKKEVFLTESAYELLKNSFNLRNRYLTQVSESIKVVNIGMCIENQTIGFIENSFRGVVECVRQYSIGKYRVDLYFPSYKLVIECDEYNHWDRDPTEEKARDEYIQSLGNKMIRYDPNEKGFDLSNVLRDIHKVMMNK